VISQVSTGVRPVHQGGIGIGPTGLVIGKLPIVPMDYRTIWTTSGVDPFVSQAQLIGESITPGSFSRKGDQFTRIVVQSAIRFRCWKESVEVILDRKTGTK
jgi:hypothetical protein